MVNPGELLSPQTNDHHTGRWIVVRGMAKVTVGERTVTLKDDESVLIPRGERHGLENVGGNPLEMIEVQVGSHIWEEDVVWSGNGYGSD
ncbi:MAG: Mannose-1-phosphate guanylyltransferase 1 [Syntrophorhabdus sp. PtaB.Bin047]|jgi:mannose-6-phosphate isomerase-like protein (cupin superfamily)|nr:MAG: Mannose-1-phosphate guanylyltransferase 1 [Syntrophorhabdus sp. PtaB.Bin047]